MNLPYRFVCFPTPQNNPGPGNFGNFKHFEVWCRTKQTSSLGCITCIRALLVYENDTSQAPLEFMNIRTAAPHSERFRGRTPSHQSWPVYEAPCLAALAPLPPHSRLSTHNYRGFSARALTPNNSLKRAPLATPAHECSSPQSHRLTARVRSHCFFMADENRSRDFLRIAEDLSVSIGGACGWLAGVPGSVAGSTRMDN